MPASQYGPNLAEAFLAGENILTNRANRQVAQAEAKRQNRTNELLGKYAAGDQSAKDELLLTNPDLMKKYADAVGKMDENQREKIKQFSAGLAKYAYLIMNSGNPESEWARLYQNAPQPVQEAMGQQYSPAAVKEMYINGMTMAELTKNPSVVEFGGKDMLFKGGQMLGSTTSGAMLRKNIDVGEKAKDRAFQGSENQKNRANMLTRAKISAGGKVDGDTPLKSADESLMFRQAASMYGGTFDQNGNLIALDPSVRPKVQQITTEATKIYRQGGVSRSEAVSRAYENIEGKTATGRRIVKPFM